MHVYRNAKTRMLDKHAVPHGIPTRAWQGLIVFIERAGKNNLAVRRRKDRSTVAYRIIDSPMARAKTAIDVIIARHRKTELRATTATRNFLQLEILAAIVDLVSPTQKVVVGIFGEVQAMIHQLDPGVTAGGFGVDKRIVLGFGGSIIRPNMGVVVGAAIDHLGGIPSQTQDHRITDGLQLPLLIVVVLPGIKREAGAVGNRAGLAADIQVDHLARRGMGNFVQCHIIFSFRNLVFFERSFNKEKISEDL